MIFDSLISGINEASTPLMIKGFSTCTNLFSDLLQAKINNIKIKK
jgi:hypothetical protein